MAGICNPYLSQIERGLREPSERMPDAIARSLKTSTDALYEQAGINAGAGRRGRGRDPRGDRGRPPVDGPPAARSVGGLRRVLGCESAFAQLARANVNGAG
jgi:hypothetical protein